MKKRAQIAAASLAFIGAVVAAGYWQWSGEYASSKQPSPPRPDVEAAIGVKEDPNARTRYEWRRLRNPQTGTIPANIRRKELAFAKTFSVRKTANKGQATSWTKRGPVNLGGRSRALAVDLSDESRLLAGGVSGGMFLSTDGGTSWTQTFTADQLKSVTSIAQDTTNGKTGVWYAGTGEYLGNSANGGGNAFFRGDGIYKSTDDGQSWSLLAAASSGTPHLFDNLLDYVWEVAVDPSNPSEDEVYAAAYSRIYRSTDGGGSWAEVLTEGSNYSSTTDIQVTTTGIVYAALGGDGDNAGIYRSPDGTSFTDITPGGFPAALNYGRIELAVDPSNEDLMWALARTPGQGTSNHMLMQYDDASDTWTDFSSYLPDRGGTTGSFNSQLGYDLLVKVHPSNGDLVYVGGRNLWRLDVSGSSTDADTWIGGYTHANDSYAAYHPSGSDPHHPDQHAIAFRPSDGDVMYVGSDGGIHRTDDNRASGDGGVQWTDLNDGYYTTQFYTVCFNPDPSDPVIAGGMQDNGTWSTTSSSVGDPWMEELSGDGSYCAITNSQQSSGTSRYASAQRGQIYRFVYDTNGNYKNFTRVDPSGASGYLFINPFALDPADPKIMYLPAQDELWRNSNLEDIALGSSSPTSTNWAEMTGSLLSSGQYTALDVSHSTHRLYLGTSNGRVYRLDNAHTASASTTPSDVTGSGFPSGYVSSIAVHPNDADKVLVTFSNYEVKSVFYTGDGGASWTDVSGDLEQNPDGSGDGPSVRWATILPNATNGTQYFVGTSTGLYATSTLDGTATTWMQEGASSIGNVVVDQVHAREADGLVLAGTHANGVYSSTVTIPVELVAFEGQLSDEQSILTWTTASETNNAGFAVERKPEEASAWQKVGYVDGAGTTTETQEYRFVDDALPFRAESISYRLKQVDLDGTVEYSHAVELQRDAPKRMVLQGSFPNPFRDRTTIRYKLASPGHVMLTVHDVLGRHVATLVDEQQEAGRYQMPFEASSLASGTYFARLTTNGAVQIQRLSVAR